MRQDDPKILVAVLPITTSHSLLPSDDSDVDLLLLLDLQVFDLVFDLVLLFEPLLLDLVLEPLLLDLVLEPLLFDLVLEPLLFDFVLEPLLLDLSLLLSLLLPLDLSLLFLLFLALDAKGVKSITWLMAGGSTAGATSVSPSPLEADPRVTIASALSACFIFKLISIPRSSGLKRGFAEYQKA